jgi:hypothetical protein
MIFSEKSLICKTKIYFLQHLLNFVLVDKDVTVIQETRHNTIQLCDCLGCQAVYDGAIQHFSLFEFAYENSTFDWLFLLKLGKNYKMTEILK